MFAPVHFGEVKKIVEFYKQGCQIVLQLDKVADRDVERHIVDFFLGAACMVDGVLQQTGTNSYLVVPASCEFDINDSENSPEFGYGTGVTEIFS